MAENKTVETDQDVIGFIEQITSDEQKTDASMLLKLMSDISGYQPRMWGSSIIGFGKVKYKYESGRSGEMPVIAFSPRKGNLTLYICDELDKYSDHLERLGKHKRGKGCLYIKHLNQVSMEVLHEMITLSVANTIKDYQ